MNIYIYMYIYIYTVYPDLRTTFVYDELDDKSHNFDDSPNVYKSYHVWSAPNL